MWSTPSSRWAHVVARSAFAGGIFTPDVGVDEPLMAYKTDLQDIQVRRGKMPRRSVAGVVMVEVQVAGRVARALRARAAVRLPPRAPLLARALSFDPHLPPSTGSFNK